MLRERPFPDGIAEVVRFSCCAEALASRTKHAAVIIVLIRCSSTKDTPTVQNQHRTVNETVIANGVPADAVKNRITGRK
jgi:hypothetical protein